MITAIPMRGDKISSHFKKAPQFIFFDQDGQQIGQLDNPAHPDRSEDCSSTTTLMDEFENFKVTRVVVRNIGERMLTRLLPVGVEVWQTPTRDRTPADLATSNNHLFALTNPAEGREPKNHLKKLENGGCSGCSGDHHGCADKNTSSQSCCARTTTQPSRLRFGSKLRKLMGW